MTKTTAAKLLTSVQVSKLSLSPINPRQNVSEEEIESLAQSIKVCGVIQNLVGLKDGETIGIVAGGRRLRALQLLLKNKDILPSYTVPVRIAANEEQALEWANAENSARKDLNPADEIRAYRTMQDKGYQPEKIAIAFAQTVRHVKGRLRLAGLAPCILEALEAGTVTLDTAAAYTVNPDTEKQSEAFKRLQNLWNGDQPNTIKRHLMNEAKDQSDRRAVFVGRSTYEAAGGEVREDLFGEQVYYLDSTLLEKLTMDKLEAIKQEYLSDGWKWVQADVDLPDYTMRATCLRIHAERGRLNKEQEERYSELTDAVEEGEASEAEVAELAALKALEKPRFSAEQKSVSGIYLAVDHYGFLTTFPGHILAEDQDAAIAAKVLKEEATKPASATAGKAAAKEKTGGYSQALFDDMSIIRTGALQAALLEDTELAKDIAIFSMVTRGYEDILPCRIDVRTWEKEVEGHGQSLPEELTGEELTDTGTQRPDKNQIAERFAAFRQKTAEEKAAILTLAVARSLAAPATTKEKSVPFVELIAKSLDLDPRKTWTPNAQFFKRLNSDQLDDVRSYIDGKLVDPKFASLKKNEKVERLHGLFNSEAERNGLSAEQKERIANWVPECLQNRMTAEAADAPEAAKLAA